jgi:hypothetical protein
VLRFAPGLEATAPRSRAADQELTRLFLAQASIVSRELLLRKRAMDSNRWLGAERIVLEDHDTWE